MAELVRCEELRLEYRRGVPVIEDVSFTVATGEIVCIVGSSGCGKSTLLRAITGLLPPAAGTLEVAGDVRDIGVVFQSYERSLMPWLRVQANVELPLRGRVPKAERRRRAIDALVAVGMGDYARSYPRELSGGMQQRVAIARALALEPQLLVMDEPFASLDAQTRADLEDELLALHARYRVSIVLVTHDIDESVYLGDRVVVLGGSPCAVAAEVDIDLERPRDQLTTKESAGFLHARHLVFEALRHRRAPSSSHPDLHPSLHTDFHPSLHPDFHPSLHPQGVTDDHHIPVRS